MNYEMSTNTIAVTPRGEGFHVSINGEDSKTFTGGGQAAVEWALLMLRCRKLEAIIKDHASWLHSRTPEQVNKVSAAFFRDMAVDLRTAAGITQ